VRDDRMINLRPVNLRAGQKPRAAENGRAHIEKIETREFARYVQVGLEESANRPDVLPVALKHKGEHPVIGNGIGNDVSPKIGESIIQQAENDISVKNVNAH